ncbi:MAG: 2,3,4,5-tetrahydropyridine-2,6-dicarboxylate N-succinyltransferase [Polyangiaceae bacterium]
MPTTDAHRLEDLKALVSAAFEDRALLSDDKHKQAVLDTLGLLDSGQIRVATQDGPGKWTTHAWIKQAVLLYFGVAQMETWHAGPIEFFDKVPLKHNLQEAGVRVVPPGTVRFGSFIERGAIVMPGYVNIGAYVGSGTMVDTWATVGSCAQIGKDCHLSGGVGIGGVLEPPGAQPVIIEDGCFIGSRCIVVEGMLIERESVIGAGVTLTSSTQVIDVTGSEPVELKGRIPPRSVVIPGTRTKRFPAGEYQVPCALIIGQRKESTDKKTSLNTALREFNVSV